MEKRNYREEIIREFKRAPKTEPELVSVLECTKQNVNYHRIRLSAGGYIRPTGIKRKGAEEYAWIQEGKKVDSAEIDLVLENLGFDFENNRFRPKYNNVIKKTGESAAKHLRKICRDKYVVYNKKVLDGLLEFLKEAVSDSNYKDLYNYLLSSLMSIFCQAKAEVYPDVIKKIKEFKGNIIQIMLNDSIETLARREAISILTEFEDEEILNEFLKLVRDKDYDSHLESSVAGAIFRLAKIYPLVIERELYTRIGSATESNPKRRFQILLSHIHRFT